MSATTAIAAATLTLRELLRQKVPERDSGVSTPLTVTTYPLDVANKNGAGQKLNLFLYHTAVNAGWRNMDMPRHLKPGEAGTPPLALNLHFLITAFGPEADEDAVSYRLLGSAMSVLHDHPVLDRAELEAALPGNGLSDQFEALRITPLSASLEDMSKLWTAFQTSYRLSTSYEATVVLIDSARPVRAPLPVLRRGETDRGPTAVAGAAPHLRILKFQREQPAVRLGEDVTIVGERLSVADTVARLSNPRLRDPIELALAPGAAPGELVIHLPSTGEDADALSRWVPGFYTVALVMRRPETPAFASNELPLAFAPRITVSPSAAAAGTVNLTITCEPRIALGQRVLLLFGDRQIEAEAITTPADTAQPTTASFSIPEVTEGSYVVRLRVDGVDSFPFVFDEANRKFVFDDAQKVTIA